MRQGLYEKEYIIAHTTTILHFENKRRMGTNISEAGIGNANVSQPCSGYP